MSLCLAGAGVAKTLVLAAFTLAWTHSVEKTAWQEDWRITPAGFELIAARIKGSGAGMEPGRDARLVGGWYEWHPHIRPLPQVVLGNSGMAGEWRLCHDGACQTLSQIMGHTIGAQPVTISMCE